MRPSYISLKKGIKTMEEKERTIEEVKAELEEKKAELEQLRQEQLEQKSLAEQVADIKKASDEQLAEQKKKAEAEKQELKEVIMQLVKGEKAPEPEPTIADKINAKIDKMKFKI